MNWKSIIIITFMNHIICRLQIVPLKLRPSEVTQHSYVVLYSKTHETLAHHNYRKFPKMFSTSFFQ